MVCLFIFFNLKVSPKLSHVANLRFNVLLKNIASNYEGLKDINYDSLFKVTLNDKKEILMVDYDMQEIYKLSNVITTDIMKNISNLNEGYVSYPNYNTVLLMLPLGVMFDAVFLNELGPNIPILFRFVTAAFTNVKTRLTNYGINNALAQIYLDVSFSYDILTPVGMESEELSFTILLGSKIITGVVPYWYGREMISESALVREDFLMV